jgi:hypothetical protein
MTPEQYAIIDIYKMLFPNMRPASPGLAYKMIKAKLKVTMNDKLLRERINKMRGAISTLNDELNELYNDFNEGNK